ncbi:MAG: pentapeptide repeat-containing protein [Candidatus Thiodiazotropha taylori]|uniref:Pentapeptide repeat-containing protein n=1 Tax=Candidatus Thiodiazotropha taylori TaxID=2792791 RepID=A0A9E4KBX9_9GAMM|nr:pentapeptide repeat-containing protein [Candidatus Thiodiazotropha taylori]MCW4255948.1 pentapeptide repeat-containing protein [Candidatus Thiodiazotropha taylori]
MENKLYEIKNRWTGEVIFSLECGSLKLAVEAALEKRVNLDDAYLRGADLRGADLGGADLGGADLRDAYLRGAYLGGADLGGADLGGADLGGAYLGDADLGGADLGGADLGGADLRDAYLRGAYLGGAKIADDITINKNPIQLIGPSYFVIIFDEHMTIGCEFHSLADWFDFDDKRIIEMDGKEAMTFWKQWKEPLKAICIADERYSESQEKAA